MPTDSRSPDSSVTAPPIGVRQVAADRIWHWLKLSWRDIRSATGISLLHGLIVAFTSIAILQIAAYYWPILPGAISGFVLVGPILATGLYAASRRLEEQRQPNLRDVFCAWRCATRCLLRFNFLLVFAGTIWVALSATLFHLFVPVQIDTPVDFLRYVITQSDHLFLLWTLLGSMGMAVVFAVTVISVPLLLDKEIDMYTAMSVSIRVVGENPGVMTLWALFIVCATGLSFLTLMLGFVILYPLMGHASWHLYRDLVDASALASRDTGVTSP